MTKVLKESAVTTREARKRLPVGVHWRGIDPEVHLGYRKGKRGGVWLVRWRNGQGYRQAPLGTADDALDEGTLDFNAAVRCARDNVEAARAQSKATIEGPALTVRLAVEAYIMGRDARDSRRKGTPTRSDAASRLGRHLLGQEAQPPRKTIPPAPLAAVALHTLREVDLSAWRANLSAEMKASSKQRLVNDLRAALNAAYAGNRDRLAPTLPGIIKHGLRTESSGDDDVPLARDNQILSDAQVTKLLTAARAIDAEAAWEGDLFRLVATLAATGARFSQIVRMRVCDVQRSQGRLMIPSSRKGKGSKNSAVPVPVGKDILEALLPAITGREKEAPLFERWRSRQVPGAIRWERVGRAPWKAAAELVRPWNLIRNNAQMVGVIPYALRHSSIVRGIRANLPIRLVAALHDTSVPMIERHYGRWVADGLEDLAARAVVPLLMQSDDNNVFSTTTTEALAYKTTPAFMHGSNPAPDSQHEELVEVISTGEGGEVGVSNWDIVGNRLHQ